MHLKLMRRFRVTPLTNEVQYHVKVAHISPWYGAYLNLDEDIIARALIVDAKLNLKLTQE